jgi:hypothetical protein
VSIIAHIITSHGAQFDQYADDTQHYIAVKSDSDIAKLDECTLAVRDWFTRNGMLLNQNKSEFYSWHGDRSLPADRESTSLVFLLRTLYN